MQLEDGRLLVDNVRFDALIRQANRLYALRMKTYVESTPCTCAHSSGDHTAEQLQAAGIVRCFFKDSCCFLRRAEPLASQGFGALSCDRARTVGATLPR